MVTRNASFADSHRRKTDGPKRAAVVVMALVFLWASALPVLSVDTPENDTRAAEVPLKGVSDSAIETRLNAVIDNIADFENVK